MADMKRDVKDDRPFHRGLTREHVLATAVTILDAEGRDALTMRRLAHELGVKAPSLYVHVRSKDDLLTGVLDTVLDEVVLPRVSTSWRRSLLAGFGEYRRVLVRHPGAVLLLTSRAHASPSQVRLVERSILLLEGAGLPTAAAVSAHVTLVAYTLGFVLQEVATRPVAAPDPSAPPPPPPSDVFVRAVTALGRIDVDRRFRDGLDLILDGLHAGRREG
jgi:AcrR family transcriptional regulator